MVHAKNSSAWEVEAGVSGVHSHPQLHSEFKASLGIENMGGGEGRQEERKEGLIGKYVSVDLRNH